MKLSEAMMLGSTTCKMTPRDWNSCALGCAANAIGIGQAETEWMVMPDGRDRHEHIYEAWPWLMDGFSLNQSCFCARIFRTFDDVVCNGKMTLEQLADYVRSVEPSCGDCNRFDCSCVKSEAVPVAETVLA